jgi:hypothetical protein
MKKTKYPTIDTPKKGQIRFTEIIKHVIDTGELFPLPQGYTCEDIAYDTPECLQWVGHVEWCSISKADYARAMNVAPSQVTRWVKAGMPELPDGRLPYFEIDLWLTRYDAENERKRAEGWRNHEGNADKQ